MTTIAFDGRFLAADRRTTFGSEVSAQAAQKLDVTGNPPTPFAFTGRITETWRAALITWWLGGRVGELPPNYGTDPDGNFIVVDTDGDVQALSYACPYPWKMASPCAFGSGADFATRRDACQQVSDGGSRDRRPMRHPHGWRGAVHRHSGLGSCRAGLVRRRHGSAPAQSAAEGARGMTSDNVAMKG